jgi:hypothetical protein
MTDHHPALALTLNTGPVPGGYQPRLGTGPVPRARRPPGTVIDFFGS